MSKIAEGYKQTEVGIIPRDWDVKLGSDLSEKITKGASPRWQGFSYQDYGVLFVTSENVQDGWLDITEPKYLLFSFSEKQRNSQLNNLEFSLPSKEEQTRIAQILFDVDAEIEDLEKKLEKYKMLKQGMMQNLLTGKIRLV